MTLATFSMRLGGIAQQINEAERRNAEKDKLAADMVPLRDAYNKAMEYKQLFDRGLKKLAVACTGYRDERLGALEEYTENALALVFPEEDFRIKFEMDTSGKHELATMLIGRPLANGEIRWGSPFCRNGDFAKQLMSLTVTGSINIMLGSQGMMADEPLSNGDPISVAETAPLFQFFRESGLQMVFIEHQETAYTGLERQEIILEKNRNTGVCTVVSNNREEAITVGAESSSVDLGGVFSSAGRVHLETAGFES